MSMLLRRYHENAEAVETVEEVETVEAVDYDDLKKAELLAIAHEKGLDVTERNTVAEIKAALKEVDGDE